MKRTRMRRKGTALMLALSMAVVTVLSLSVTVSAAGGTWTYEDNGGVTISGQSATAEIPDTVATDPDANKTDIDVQARVTGGGDIVYNVEITWGDMQFEYDYGSAWNPATHSYQPVGATTGWNTNDYVDGTNNKINIVNHSNFPVLATFEYAGVPDIFGTPLSGYPVGGIFHTNNATLATLVTANNTDPASYSAPTLTLNTNKTGLVTGDRYYYKTSDDGNYSGSVYFSLLGTPGRNLNMSQFTSVGTVTVRIAPETGVTTALK